ncbi:MAG: hypothetical protein QOD41_4708, partial [Cryptosporangiaceae bacterium]|nr:hypothetical protein [Cryptosporangiaceae bacterium]
MSREVQGVFVAVAGVIMLRLALFGEYLNYVKPSLQPYLVAASLGITVLGLASFLLDAVFPRQADPGQADPGQAGADDGHDHGGRAPWSGWLFGIPMAVILLVPPPPLGSYAANRTGATVPRPASLRFAPLRSGGIVALLVRDYAARATWDQGRTLSGRTVRLSGFAVPQAGGGWYLARATLTCCAADARTVKVEVDGSRSSFATDAWVTVTGSWTAS